MHKVAFLLLNGSQKTCFCMDLFSEPNTLSGPNAYQVQQLLYPTVSSKQSSVLAKAVYYSQILNANLEFSGLTGGQVIH